MRQVVVNYAASAGPAQEVADAIKASGGDAIVVGADMSKKEDIDRCGSHAPGRVSLALASDLCFHSDPCRSALLLCNASSH